MATYVQSQQDKMPSIGLLALAATLAIYVFSQIDICTPPAYVTGVIFLGGGTIQLLSGIRSQRQGRAYAAATLLPLGIFWLSLISYEITPQLGVGRHPDAITMFSFMSLWGMFMAILFLGSFRQSVAIQTLYGSMMFYFLALAMDHLRDDRVFLLVGSGIGVFASLVATYIVIAQRYNSFCGRSVLPLGEFEVIESTPEAD